MTLAMKIICDQLLGCALNTKKHERLALSISKKLGVAETTVYKWFEETRNPSDANAKKLYKYFGLKIKDGVVNAAD